MREAGRASIFPLLGEGVFVVRVDCIVLNTPGSPTPQRNNSLHLLYMSHYAHTGCRSTDSQTEGQQERLHGFRIRLLSVPDTLYVFVTDSRKQTKAARIDKGVLVALQLQNLSLDFITETSLLSDFPTLGKYTVCSQRPRCLGSVFTETAVNSNLLCLENFGAFESRRHPCWY